MFTYDFHIHIMDEKCYITTSSSTTNTTNTIIIHNSPSTLPVCHCSGRCCGRQCSAVVPNKIDKDQLGVDSLSHLLSHTGSLPVMSLLLYVGNEGEGMGWCTGLVSIVVLVLVRQRSGKLR